MCTVVLTMVAAATECDLLSLGLVFVVVAMGGLAGLFMLAVVLVVLLVFAITVLFAFFVVKIDRVPYRRDLIAMIGPVAAKTGERTPVAQVVKFALPVPGVGVVGPVLASSILQSPVCFRNA